MRIDARRTALLAAVVAVSAAIVSQLAARRTPSARIPIGGFVLALFLTAAAEATPELGRKISQLVIAGSLFVFGRDGFLLVQNVLDRQPSEEQEPSA